MNEHESAETLLRQIKNTEDPPPRYRLMRRLANMGAAAILALRQKLYDDPDLRFDAALTLAWMSGPAIPVLLEALQNTNPDVRGAAAEVLINTHDADEQLHPLALQALADPDPRVRRGALAWCRQNRLAAAAPKMLDLLHDDDPVVLTRAIDAVGEVFRLKAALPRLLDLLDHPAEEIRQQVGRSLLFLQDASIVPRLIEKFGKTGDRYLRKLLIDALVPVADAQEIEALRAQLPAEDEHLRAYLQASIQRRQDLP